MYQPPHFREERLDVQHALIRNHPLGLLISSGEDGLIVFQGAEHYITPSWYETKRETGKVVPTWNYAIVQVRGRVRVIEDSQWIRAQVDRLTDGHESKRMIPWAVGDAPDEFITAQLKGIVGIEVEITAIDGKWKVSQNRGEPDRRGVAEGLTGMGTAEAGAMAELVKTYGGLD